MRIIDGNQIADNILESIKDNVSKLDRQPILKIIMIGNNKASEVYVQKKMEAGLKVGIKVELDKFEECDTKEIVSLVEKYNADISINGIILQLPTNSPDEDLICKTISHLKDVDGLNPYTIGELWLNKNPKIIPATAKAIVKVIQYIAKEEKVSLEDLLLSKNVLLINRSNIIGKPLAGILNNLNATVTIAHSKTKNLDSLIENSDIIISGTGKYEFINNNTKFKKDTILIDSGFVKVDKKIFGDVSKKFNNNNVSWITKVPGGIGPIGVACLIENTLERFTDKF